jgi:hypothetical protein
MMAAEFIHGVVCTLYLVSLVGDFHSRQIGTIVGSAIVLTLACLCINGPVQKALAIWYCWAVCTPL